MILTYIKEILQSDWRTGKEREAKLLAYKGRFLRRWSHFLVSCL